MYNSVNFSLTYVHTENITIAGRACQVVNTLRQVAPIAISYEGAPIELNEAAAVS